MKRLLLIPPPVLALACALASLSLGRGASQALPAYAASMLLCVFAAIIGASAVVAFRRNETTIDPVNPDRASVLVQSGVFRFSRNPMYLSLALLLLALAAAQNSIYAMIGPAAFVLMMQFNQIPREEEALRKAFPHEYERYCAMTRRWF